MGHIHKPWGIFYNEKIKETSDIILKSIIKDSAIKNAKVFIENFKYDYVIEDSCINNLIDKNDELIEFIDFFFSKQQVAEKLLVTDKRKEEMYHTDDREYQTISVLKEMAMNKIIEEAKKRILFKFYGIGKEEDLYPMLD